MKTTTICLGLLITFISCGPSEAEKESRSKMVQDSIMAKVMADSMESVASANYDATETQTAEKMIADFNFNIFKRRSEQQKFWEGILKKAIGVGRWSSNMDFVGGESNLTIGTVYELASGNLMERFDTLAGFSNSDIKNCINEGAFFPYSKVTDVHVGTLFGGQVTFTGDPGIKLVMDSLLNTANHKNSKVSFEYKINSLLVNRFKSMIKKDSAKVSDYLASLRAQNNCFISKVLMIKNCNVDITVDNKLFAKLEATLSPGTQTIKIGDAQGTIKVNHAKASTLSIVGDPAELYTMYIYPDKF